MNATRLATWLVASLAVQAFAAQAASGCAATAGATFRDDFKSPSPQWSIDGNHSYFIDGQLALKPEPNGVTSVMVRDSSLKRATFCVDMRSPADPNTDLSGGLVFWRIDRRYFTAVVRPNGTYEINMFEDGKWTTVVPATKSPKLNAGPNARNEIKVTTLNNVVTLYLNGDKASEIYVQAAPMAGGSFGVYAESTRDRRSEWRVLDFSAASLANPVGRHDVRRATSAGTVAVERTGDTFRVVWTVNGRSTEGIGMLDGETFSVAFSSGMEAGIAVYAVSEKGWDGLVTTGAAGGEPIRESWVRK